MLLGGFGLLGVEDVDGSLEAYLIHGRDADMSRSWAGRTRIKDRRERTEKKKQRKEKTEKATSTPKETWANWG